MSTRIYAAPAVEGLIFAPLSTNIVVFNLFICFILLGEVSYWEWNVCFNIKILNK